ncbi:MAG: hypothetical protein NZ530_05510 [Thermodesulfobacteriaceae bacterium]|nr:hypothetical protein [Thermodesulfobacteriaceae bacterium]MCX8041478.1 hypothetical protein [Thermodesulfobacteriaceae bacterium]MDW8135948.1 hypothetical protein [Thermodesulfobacterium sp.]
MQTRTPPIEKLKNYFQGDLFMKKNRKVKYGISEEVLLRLKVIELHDKYVALKLLNLPLEFQRPLYIEGKTFRDSGGKFKSLISNSRAPKRQTEALKSLSSGIYFAI